MTRIAMIVGVIGALQVSALSPATASDYCREHKKLPEYAKCIEGVIIKLQGRLDALENSKTGAVRLGTQVQITQKDKDAKEDSCLDSQETVTRMKTCLPTNEANFDKELFKILKNPKSP